MKKYLVLYRMDIAEMRKLMASTSEEERKKSMGKCGSLDADGESAPLRFRKRSAFCIA